MLRRFACLVALSLLSLACEKQPKQAPASTGESTDANPPEPTPPEPTPPDPFAIGPGKQPVALTAEQIDAPIPTEPPPLDFWKRGEAACEPGTTLQGAAPPRGDAIRCVAQDGRWTGWEARFHSVESPQLQMIGRKQDGKMVGVWLFFHPSGAKAAEHPYVDGQLHGTMLRFAENGQEIERGEWRAGRPFGLFVQHDEAGNEIGRAQLDRGTGVLVLASEGRRTESDYVDGVLHGKHREYDAKTGRLLGEAEWSGGEQHGVEVRFGPLGHKLTEDHWKHGRRHGESTRWSHGGELVERSIWIDGKERTRQLFRDGEPLAPLPAATTCDDDAGLSNYLAAARGRGLSDQHACVTRMPLFPGVVMLGDFAHDLGCTGAQWVIDCKLAATAPTAAELLARAGWARATPEQRIVIAMEYLREFGLAYSGSISYSPDEPVWSMRPDQGVEAVLWVAEPAGMRRGVAMDKLRYAFAPDGTMTRELLEHRSPDD